MGEVRVRFAPSPTGRLHVGNIRTALVNFLYVRRHGGIFALRIDDTDRERCKSEYERGIREDLEWLGLVPDYCFRQSERLGCYDAAAKVLRERGLLYPCYETPEELERRRRLAIASGRPPVYDRAALGLGLRERRKFEEMGRAPHWRFKLSGERRIWTDLVRGEQAIETSSVSDPVLIRADGSYLYTLPSVVDDRDEAITHVVRGEDHVTNSGVQIEIFRALGSEAPKMAHISLLIGSGGESLSKRLGSLSVEQLRLSGVEPLALASLLARLGSSDSVKLELCLGSLSEGFEFTRMGRAPARFSMRELWDLNAELLRQTSYVEVSDQLCAMSYGSRADAAFWTAVAPNLTRMGEASDWLERLFAPAQKVEELSESDRVYLEQGLRMLPPGELSAKTWEEWTQTLSEATGRKGKALFMPLRLALTGISKGPELALLLPLIGRAGILERLRNA